MGSSNSEVLPLVNNYQMNNKKFYGCIQDETFFRHPQEQQQEREPIQ